MRRAGDVRPSNQLWVDAVLAQAQLGPFSAHGPSSDEEYVDRMLDIATHRRNEPFVIQDHAHVIEPLRAQSVFGSLVRFQFPLIQPGADAVSDAVDPDANRAAPGASHDALGSLLCVPRPPDAECLICHDGDTKAKWAQTACGHSFHTRCVSRWLRRTATCPTCRALFKTKDYGYNARHAGKITKNREPQPASSRLPYERVAKTVGRAAAKLIATDEQ
jgi:hypothetical protein